MAKMLPTRLITACLFCVSWGVAFSQPFPSYPQERLPGAGAMKSLVSMCAQSAGYYAGMANLRNEGLSIDEALAQAPSRNPYSASPSARAALSQLWKRKRYKHPIEIAADVEDIAIVGFNQCMNRNLVELSPYKPDSF